MNRSTLLFGLALSVAVAACGDDDSSDETAAGTDSDASSTSGSGPATDTTDAATTDTPTTTETTDPSGATDPSTSTTDPSGTTDAGSTGDADMSMVRVMHLGVDVPAVDVFANGAGPVFEGLEFEESSDYAQVPSGDYTFEVALAGEPAEDAVLAPMLTLDADTNYTAVAIGDLDETGDLGPAVIALVDDPSGIDAAEVRLTVVHAAPAVPTVDIYEITDSENPVELLADVDFAASAGLPDIPAGVLELGLDLDNDTDNGFDVEFTVDASGLGGGQANVYASNNGAGDVSLVIQLADGSILSIDPN